MFYGAVFCCFSPIGVLVNAQTLLTSTPSALALLAVYSGGMAVTYAWVALTKLRWFPVVLLPSSTSRSPDRAS